MKADGFQPTSHKSVFICGVVILAAGASSRMGKSKLLLPWGGTSVLGHLIDQWRGLRAGQITVVHAAADPAIGAELDRLGFPAADRIANAQPGRGMFSSIQCAARWHGWKEELTHWVILLGDQPHLRPKTLRWLLKFSAAHPRHICQPGRSGRPRHPVVLPRTDFQQLNRARDISLKVFLKNTSTDPAVCELDDPGLDLDIDTPADYENALHLWQRDRGDATMVKSGRRDL